MSFTYSKTRRANKTTGANAGGPRPLAMQTRQAARVAQFSRSAPTALLSGRDVARESRELTQIFPYGLGRLEARIRKFEPIFAEVYGRSADIAEGLSPGTPARGSVRTMNAARLLNAFVPVAAAVFLCGCPTMHTHYLAQPERLTVRGAYVHSASKFVMPESVAGFQREAIFRYDARLFLFMPLWRR